MMKCNSQSLPSLNLFLFQNIDGCFQKLLQLIEENAVIIAAVILGIAALEVSISNSL